MEIKQIMQEIHINNINKGFWDDKGTKNVGEVLMLCVSELSEALEAHRKGKFAVKSWNLEKNCGNINEESSTNDKLYFQQEFEVAIKDTFEDEIADTVIRLFDLCSGFNIDLVYHIEQKLKYNKMRPYKHNKAY